MTTSRPTWRGLVLLLACLLLPGGIVGGMYFLDWRRQTIQLQEHRAAALKQFAAHDYVGAVENLDTYLAQRPDDTEALYQNGLAHLEIYDPDGKNLRIAASLLHRVIDQNPSRVDAMRRLLAVDARIGVTAGTISIADRLLTLDPADPDALRSKALAFNELNIRDEAQAMADRYNTLRPFDFDGQWLTLSILRQSGAGTDQLVARVHQLQQQYPEDPRFELLLAFVYTRPDPVKALHWCDMAARRPAPDADFILRLVQEYDDLHEYQKARMYLGSATQTLSSPELQWAWMRRLLADGQWEDLATLAGTLTTSTAVYDAEPPALHAVALMALNRPEEALDVLESMRKRGQGAVDSSMQAWIRIVETATGSIDPAPLVKACDQALTDRRNHPLLLFYSGLGQHWDGHDDTALERWQEAAARSPSWPTPLVASAHLLQELGRNDEALHAAQQAASRDPQDLAVRRVLIQAAHTTLNPTDRDGQQDLLEKVVSLRHDLPEDSSLLPIQVDLLARLGRGSEAAKVIQSMLDGAATPSPEVLLKLARICRENKLEGFDACLARDEAAYGPSPELAMARALHLADTGDPQGGTAYLVRVIPADIAIPERPTPSSQPVRRGMSGGQEVGISIQSRISQTPDPNSPLPPSTQSAQISRLSVLWPFAPERPPLLVKENQALTSGTLAWQLVWAQYLDQINDPRAAQVWLDLNQQAPDNLPLLRATIKSHSVWNNPSRLEPLIKRLSKEPPSADVASTLAQGRWLTLYGSGDEALFQATDLLERVVRSNPNLAEARVLLAQCLDKEGKTDLALEHLSVALSLEPKSAQVALQLAALTQNRGYFSHAGDAAQSVIRMQGAKPADLHRAAEILIGQGEYDRARTALERAQALSAAGPDRLLAEIDQREGRMEKAAAACQALAQSSNPDDLVFAANIQAEMGQMDQARSTLERLQKTDLPIVVRLLDLARFEAQYGNPGAAAKGFIAATEADPQNTDAWMARITYLIDGGNVEQISMALQQAIKAIPNQPDFSALADQPDWLLLAESLPLSRPVLNALLQDRTHRAVARAVLSILQDDQAHHNLEQHVGELDSLAQANTRVFWLQMLLVDIHLLLGQASWASTFATQATTLFPVAVEPPQRAAEALAAMNRWQDAQASARIWRQRSADQPLAADLFLAHALIEGGQLSKALDVLTPYQSIPIHHPAQRLALLALRGEAMVLLGQSDQAKKLAEQALHDDPPSLARWITQVTPKLTDPTLAAGWLEQAQKLVSAGAPAEVQNVAQAWYRLGNRSGIAAYRANAITLLTQVCESSHPTPQAFESLAIALASQGDQAAAVLNYHRALAADPHLPVALNNLAMLLLEQDRTLAEADTLATQAVQLEPYTPAFCDTLARIRSRRGQYAQALEISGRSIGLEPNNPRWAVTRASILSEAGRTDEARRTVSEILAAHRIEELEPDLAAELKALRSSLASTHDTP